MTEQKVASQSPRTGIWLLLIVAGFVTIQIFNTRPEPEPPGPGRGDLVLKQNVLADEIVGWHFRRFEPALPSEQLPNGQFWWTHAWNYHRNKLDALVAFDQANWKSWHELTMCYQAIGWTLVNRQVVSISDAVSVVQATFEKPTHERATLVFSLFAQDGSVIQPPETGMPAAQENETDQSFTSLLNSRLTWKMPEGAQQSSNAETFERVLQCQVFAQHHATLSDEERHGLIELHLETLGCFRNAWLNRQPSH
jgi:hypothetical protein